MPTRPSTKRPSTSASTKSGKRAESAARRAPFIAPDFDPDAAATGDGLFGLSTSVDEANLVVIPVPYDATTSYRPGTARGPAAVLEASKQVDLEDLQYGPVWRAGFAMLPIPKEIAALSKKTRTAAEPVIEAGGAEPGNRAHARALAAVNAASERLNAHVAAEARAILDRGAIPALLGGDHSTPFGLIRELAERHPGLGVLQIDAHADLREAFEGFTYSHASIYHNVMTRIPKVGKLVQVGIRDFGSRERAFAEGSRGRIEVFYDQAMRDRQFAGGPRNAWSAISSDIVKSLPKEVYISFDIDGLTPDHCPHTGTPVPGGLTFPEVCHLLEVLSRSGKKVVGFDLCEVAPGAPGDEWDANVGARVLYKLLGCTLRTQGLLR
ncbi:MAG: agmatinase family protein [Planctomycetaceae bacterium]|nr:agmatinase family protein [Planctomycetaceae bacterium]